MEKLIPLQATARLIRQLGGQLIKMVALLN